MLRTAALLATVVVLSACGNPPAPAAVPAPLQRPQLALNAANGRILVPLAALVERGGLPGVFVLSAEQQARFRMVRSGKTVGNRIEILSGLRGDETLVLGDLRAVHDGSAISR